MKNPLKKNQVGVKEIVQHDNQKREKDKDPPRENGKRAVVPTPGIEPGPRR